MSGVLPLSRLTMSCWLWTRREYRRNLPSSSHVDNAIPRFARHSPQLPQTTPGPSDPQHLSTAWIGDMQLRFSLG